MKYSRHPCAKKMRRNNTIQKVSARYKLKYSPDSFFSTSCIFQNALIEERQIKKQKTYCAKVTMYTSLCNITGSNMCFITEECEASWNPWDFLYFMYKGKF
jgi:hypothetical protein